MKLFKKLALIATLAFALAFPAVTVTTAGAANYTTPATGYTQASDVPDKKVGNYVVNWGARGENCTFLSRYASAFYTGSYTFDTMSKYSGSSTRSDVPNSALYKNLQTLMKSRHSHQTSYSETKQQYRYTDCLKGNSSQISSFYSGKTLSGDWDGTWNREHTWPNSKGLGGNDENDIMMLRPTWTQENSSRGNTAYGTGSGYYDPNSEGTNVRGDCARIFLYVYVRWGNTSKAWGTSGVMQSVDVLLDWMEEDPVDTWEMGRNDAVQSITGTRNVFVDYPEYAWLLFGQDVPTNVSTPSGNDGTVSGGDTSGGNQGSGNTGSDSGNQGGNQGSGNTGTGSGSQASGITAPAENTAYNMYIEQKGVGKTLYLTGKMDSQNKFLEMTSDKSKATNVYAEKVTGGYKFYVLDGNNAKSYMTLTEYKSGSYYKASISYSATGNVFYYNDLGCWACDLANEIFFLGTYGTFETTSASSSYYMTADKMGTEQYPLLIAVSSTSGGNQGGGNTGSGNQGSGNTGSDSGNQGGNQGGGNTGTGSGNQGNDNTNNNVGNEEESGPCEHEYGEWVVTKEPTATEKGSKSRECEKCGRVVTQSIPKVTEEEQPAETGCSATLGGAFAGVSMTMCLGWYILKKKKQ